MSCTANSAGPEVPHCGFKQRGAEYVRESGIKRVGGGAERQCNRALGGPSAARLATTACGARRGEGARAGESRDRLGLQRGLLAVGVTQNADLGFEI
jgi:hypothetical protein